MITIHTFVAEVTTDLIHTFKTTYNKALQVQLRRDTQVHIYVQRVMMRDERTSRSTTGYLLQNRCLHFRVTCLVKYLTHRTQDSCTFEECILHAFIHYQVHITLTITLLRIIESVVCHTVFVLHDRQRFERFGEYCQFLRMHGYLTHLRAENETFDTDKITDVQQFLKYHIVHLLLNSRRLLTFRKRCLNIITADIHLNTSFRVLQLDERCLTHDSFRHQSTCDTYFITRVPFVS